ncbi:MAG: alpha-amylase family glycosyl hydrolase [Lentisphaeraceae bacterium]|nr:alpha-amylase family glycosyl hydrolase [Lentisphaeraceae bacterium]
MELISKYKEVITPKPHVESEKDVILICYGDHLTQDGEKPLVTLKGFLDNQSQKCINSVHILPFYPYTSDDGFSVVDYTEVDRKLGTWEDIKHISQNYRLMCDAVVNHMSSKSHWFEEYLKGNDRYKDYFIDMDPSTDLTMVTRPRTSPLLTPFTAPDGTTKNIWSTFSADQVDLNYANYKVLIDVLDVLFTYVEYGATLIRLDAIAFLWKEVGSHSVHLPQTHEIIQLIREVLHQVAPEIIIITETNVPHQENVSYFGSGHDEAQMVYNFALPPLIIHSMLTGDATKMTDWAMHLELPSDKVCFFNFTASHDGVGMRPISDILSEEEVQNIVDTCRANGGLVSYRDCGDGTVKPYELNCTFKMLLTSPDKPVELRLKRMLLSQSIALAMPGVPGIYFTSLFGASNWREGAEESGVNRSINRQKFTVDELSDYLTNAVKDNFFAIYRDLIRVRTAEPCFNPYAPFRFLNLNKSLFAFEKFLEDESLFCLFNVSNDNVKINSKDLMNGSFLDIVSMKIVEGTISIPGNEFLWLKFKGEQ